MIVNDFYAFYNAAQAWLHGASPYSAYGFWNPVWGVVPFLPLTLLPMEVAQYVWVMATLFGVLIAFARFKIPPRYIIAFVVLSPLIWLNFQFANVDWLVLLGATLPPPIGIWLVSLKPQTGSIIIIGWILQTWRKDRWRGVVKLLLPISIVAVIQLVTIGVGIPDARATASNFRLLPWGIPLGVVMLIKYLRAGDEADPADAFLSALCLTPYLSLPSWIIVTPWAGRTVKRLIFTIVAVWVCLLFWHIAGDINMNTIIGLLSIPVAVWLGWKMIKDAKKSEQVAMNN